MLAFGTDGDSIWAIADHEDSGRQLQHVVDLPQ